ncbi:hypothetical protein E0Z10_g7187 [Xylaria hypoxylon]|uniref:Uncharacterized protein n=1 Tax=Xylaria hypoxylon TaxID=37992 RepID=A0A4Z0YC95_9PEZI|nr:hypothetical protein E0Z10_g7187 [Xylaria hypoxylon]
MARSWLMRRHDDEGPDEQHGVVEGKVKVKVNRTQTTPAWGLPGGRPIRVHPWPIHAVHAVYAIHAIHANPSQPASRVPKTLVAVVPTHPFPDLPF